MTTLSPTPTFLDETNAERIVAVLREDIVRLTLKPGDPVSESETALRFGVSRQPVREALIRLSQLGLVNVRARKATRVVPISEKAVLDARFVREALEVEIMRRAAQMATPGWDRELRLLLGSQEEAVAAQDLSAFHALDEAFHRKIAELAGVGFVWDLIDAQKAQLDRVRFMTLDSNLALSLEEHKAITAAILAGDGAKAEGVLRKHLGKITTHLATGRQRFPDYFVSR
ncbi:GntR family transcriptional regulator [Pelagibacterium luteolum]|uniref:Transcriptional regulator, GntR family n=1 Tax=Pelagibacterium luteolum TaxID=440168 RepID=A0A1G7YHM8_9HYPH|nr:GntR family transcriptional regulator [Pelagibacterium luteolum]SDG95874.1 transcriptional regulator, GntR family [Pelagibacterium luteolum]